MMQYFVYILINNHNTVFYTGMTNNLVRRIYEHKSRLIDGFTKKYNITKLVYFEITSTPAEAISREKQIKDYRREKKLQLIRTNNPQLTDLYEGISQG